MNVTTSGATNRKIQLAETRAELDKVKAELVRTKQRLALYENDQSKRRHRIVSREYDDRVIDELIEWSEEGLFLDECLAQWGIDSEQWSVWLAEHVTLRAAVGPARARARAAMLKTLREALKTRSAFPVSLADRIIAMVDKENGAADETASKLVSFGLCPVCMSGDGASAPSEAEGEAGAS